MEKLPTTSATAAPIPRGKFVHWPRSARRRALFTGCYVAFLLGLVWFGCQLYWSWTLGVPLTAARGDFWDYYYPKLQQSGVLTADISAQDRHLDVLMLGASTIENGWGNVEELLRAGLQQEFTEPVRIFNLATIAHTSRDSAIKFSKLADKPFDLILIYDGFNDCRMNNCAPEAFRDDYTHCAWYRSFERRRKSGFAVLPQEMLRDLGQAIGLGAPEGNLAQYGGDLKTPPAFRQNLREIMNSARQHHSLVLLQTFAYHIPAGYTDDKLKSGDLDFGSIPGGLRCPLQMWGRTEDVIKCVEAHNGMIHDLAEADPLHTVFVDQQHLMSSNGQYFVDACHFTPAGCRQFVDNLLPAVVQRLRARHSAPAK